MLAKEALPTIPIAAVGSDGSIIVRIADTPAGYPRAVRITRDGMQESVLVERLEADYTPLIPASEVAELTAQVESLRSGAAFEEDEPKPEPKPECLEVKVAELGVRGVIEIIIFMLLVTGSVLWLSSFIL